MIAVMSLLGGIVLLAVAAVYEQHRRRPLLEATIPPGTSPAARRRILHAERVRARRERIQYEARHPYPHAGW